VNYQDTNLSTKAVYLSPSLSVCLLSPSHDKRKSTLRNCIYYLPIIESTSAHASRFAHAHLPHRTAIPYGQMPFTHKSTSKPIYSLINNRSITDTGPTHYLSSFWSISGLVFLGTGRRPISSRRAIWCVRTSRPYFRFPLRTNLTYPVCERSSAHAPHSPIRDPPHGVRVDT